MLNYTCFVKTTNERGFENRSLLWRASIQERRRCTQKLASANLSGKRTEHTDRVVCHWGLQYNSNLYVHVFSLERADNIGSYFRVRKQNPNKRGKWYGNNLKIGEQR